MAYQGGNLKATSINGVKVYTVVNQNRPLPLDPKKLRALRKNKDYNQRVELIQDLRFETATTRIKATPDGEFLIASGIYPPQVKVYELRELSMKFERHLVSEIINFEVLGDDYSKIAFLCADRSVCLHAKYGSHYSLRIPRMGRDLAYDSWSCELICAASSPDLYRINLEQGRFLSSLNTKSPALNVVSRSKFHGLVAGGGEDGAIECFDMRTKSSVARLFAVSPTSDTDQGVTAIEFDGDGSFRMAVGSSGGKVMIYDLRSSSPLRVKDHMYGSPILDIKWHHTINSERPKLITTDKQIVKIWDPETGESMASIDGLEGKINDVCMFSGSGLMLLALDTSQIPFRYLPALGPAPKWCSYMENLTEELEEDSQPVVWDSYKFLTREELEKYNLTNLIGTDLLKTSIHGFFVPLQTYKNAKTVAEPFAYDAYIEQKNRDKLEKERATRITIARKLPKSNRQYYIRLKENEAAETEKKDNDAPNAKKTSKKCKGLSTEILKDERFTAMFENQDFEVDELSQEYLALHPLASNTQASLVDEHFEPAMEDEDQGLSGSDSSEAQSSDDDHANKRSKHDKVSRAPRLYEVKDERHAEAFWNRKSLAKENSLSLGERVAALTNNRQDTFNSVKTGPGGSREISFIAKSSRKYEDDDEDNETRRDKRRGIKSLKLKPDRSGFQGRGRGGRGRG